MKLVVGLGNPGLQYVGTRHNVGFEVVDALAAKLGFAPAGNFDRLARTKFDALTMEASLDTARGVEKLLLIKPTTYMNESGRSVSAAARFYKVEPADVLVIVDELALPAGKLRLRADGSDGGHNGLRSIRAALGTDAYPRLRIGIDPAPPGFAGRDYVLGRFSPEQRAQVDAALGRAAACCVVWIDGGVTRAMNEFNPD